MKTVNRLLRERDNKTMLLGFRFALIKLGIAEDSPLWNWMQQEFQVWLTGGYEGILSQSIMNTLVNAQHDRNEAISLLQPEMFTFKTRSTKDEQRNKRRGRR